MEKEDLKDKKLTEKEAEDVTGGLSMIPEKNGDNDKQPIDANPQVSTGKPL